MQLVQVLFLDDNKERYRKFIKVLEEIKSKSFDIRFSLTWAKTASEAIQQLKTHQFNYIFLDHDLGDEIMVPSGPGTGYEVAEWISQHLPYTPGQIVIHSHNPSGAENMKKVLKNAQIVPFSILIQSYKMQFR